MKQHELNVTAKKARKRVGRGISAGGGKTAGRGTKGQKSRTGGNLRVGFEGGQTPLLQKIPKKRGFRSLAKPVYEVKTGQLGDIQGEVIDFKSVVAAGLVPASARRVKVILKGEVSANKSVLLPQASKGAVAAIEKAGGKFTPTELTKEKVKVKQETKEG